MLDGKKDSHAYDIVGSNVDEEIAGLLVLTPGIGTGTLNEIVKLGFSGTSWICSCPADCSSWIALTRLARWETGVSIFEVIDKHFLISLPAADHPEKQTCQYRVNGSH